MSRLADPISVSLKLDLAILLVASVHVCICTLFFGSP